MDPLSITAGVTGLIVFVHQSINGVSKLSSLKHAQDEFLSLLNELADFQAILSQMIAFSREMETRPGDESVVALRSLMEGARAHLLELQQLVEFELTTPQPKRPEGKKVDRLGWAFKQKKIASVQQKLRTTRLNIATALGIVNG